MPRRSWAKSSRGFVSGSRTAISALGPGSPPLGRDDSHCKKFVIPADALAETRDPRATDITRSRIHVKHPRD